MEQLRVYNPNDGTWGRIEGSVPVKNGIIGLMYAGQGISVWGPGGSGTGHPVTPIEAPIEWRLGQDVLASVKGEDRDRVIAYRPARPDEWIAMAGGALQVGTSTESDFPILSPPAPEPRTNREVFESVLAKIKEFGPTGKLLRGIESEIEQHIETKPSPE